MRSALSLPLSQTFPDFLEVSQTFLELSLLRFSNFLGRPPTFSNFLYYVLQLYRTFSDFLGLSLLGSPTVSDFLRLSRTFPTTFSHFLGLSQTFLELSLLRSPTFSDLSSEILLDNN